MKRCPECKKDYFDDSLLYCLDDGAQLATGSIIDEPPTAILSGDDISDEGLTKQLKADGTIPRTRLITFSLPASFSGRRLAWVVACVLALVAAIFAYGYLNRSSNIGAKVVRLAFNPPPELSFNDVQQDWAVISPDGQKIAFTATANGMNMLYVRDLDSTEARVLPGAENPIEPFWSPDSRSIAYGSNGKLKRSDLFGGNPQVVCDAARIVGGSWSKDGVIIFAPDYRARITQVSAKGGEPRVIDINSETIEYERHNNPIFMPDGRHFLYRRQADDPNDASGIKRMGIWAGSLDSPEGKQILPDDASFAYTSEGWLVFVRNDTLVAQAFDAAKLQVSGEPIPIISGQVNAPGNNRLFSISDNGVLVWQGVWEREYQLIWFDRDGKRTGVVGTPARVGVGQDPRISPEGKRLLVKRGVPRTLWVTDLEKGTDLRLTSNFGQLPVWSPDGSKVAFSANPGLSVKAANGLGDAETLLPGLNFPFCWSPDGRFIIFLRRGVKTRFDMYALSLVGERKELPLSTAAFDEQTPQISPDGKWLAYSSDETGKYEIYVQSFSADGKLGSDRKLISGAGGFMPVWRRDGSELFFIAADGQMMVSAIKSGGGEFEFNSPKALFKTKMLDVIHNNHEFDVSPDGQRFLIGTLIGEPTAPPPTVILNWPSLLRNQ